MGRLARSRCLVVACTGAPPQLSRPPGGPKPVQACPGGGWGMGSPAGQRAEEPMEWAKGQLRRAWRVLEQGSPSLSWCCSLLPRGLWSGQVSAPHQPSSHRRKAFGFWSFLIRDLVSCSGSPHHWYGLPRFTNEKRDAVAKEKQLPQKSHEDAQRLLPAFAKAHLP